MIVAGPREHALRQPAECAQWLSSDTNVVGSHVTVVTGERGLTVFRVDFEPPPVEYRLRFPAEAAHVLVAGLGDPVATPVGPKRPWRHIYPRAPLSALPGQRVVRVPLAELVGGLCLWYPDDPPVLKWSWVKGLGDFVRILQRHLWFEEFWRRTGVWPVEDAPHGRRPDNTPHPILDQRFLEAS